MRRIPRLVISTSLLVVLTGACGGGPDAPRIDDAAFSRNAARVCAEALPQLRPDLKDEKTRSEREVAATVDERADQLEKVVGRLRRVPATTTARPAVDAWLDQWEAYVVGGRRYADSLRKGDPKAYTRVASDARRPLGPISAFARANGMRSCALDVVPLPARESPI